MGLERDEDKLEGEFGKRRSVSAGGRSIVPDISVSGGGKRARAAWFNRQRGAGGVKLKVERPAGTQHVVVIINPKVHAEIGGGAGSMMRHTLYVERDGAGRDGDKVQVFDRDLDRAEGADFVERCEGDRHHFRVILSPERGGELEDLKRYTRELMARVERDLRTRIDWIAAEHHDTGHPHVHLLVRGVRDDGRDLVIPREYISHTWRQRAEELATRELGPRLDRGLGHDLDHRAERAAKLERPTHLDRALLECARDREVCIADLPAESHLRNPLIQRLNRLEDWGLAERQVGDRWRLDRELEDKLTRLGDARDRERATARLLASEDRGPEPARTRVLEEAHRSQRVTGRLVGFEQMGTDARGPYMIGVEGIDGKFWTARVARLEDLRSLNGVERGAIVSLTRATPELKPADRTILEIAGGDRLYSADRHREIVPSDREKYIQMHVRRLEALRMEGVVERDLKGVFYLPNDYEKRVLARDTMAGRESAKVTLLDPHPLEKQAQHRGPAWIDRMADGREDRSQLADHGFGGETRRAWQQREQTLKDLGVGRDGPNGFGMTGDAQKRLNGMERDDLREKVERDTGRVAHVARDGERVEGLFVSRIHAAEKSYALIIQDRAATLAPWRPDIDRALGQFVSGQVNGHQLDFNYGRDVGKALPKGLDLGR